MGKTETKIILHQRESHWQTWSRDASTLALFLGLIGPGIYFESAWLQATGFAVAWIFTLAQVSKHKNEMTIDEARKWLDEMEAPNAD